MALNNTSTTALVTTCSLLVLFGVVYTETALAGYYTGSRSISEGEIYTDGDLIFSALLPIHTSTVNGSTKCSEIYINGLVLVEAVTFAVSEVHHQNLLPEGVTLGFEILDTCNSVLVTQRRTLGLVLRALNDIKHQSTMNRTSGKLIAVIGAGSSKISLSVNRILNTLGIPQVGFASTSRYLSDKLRYSSFLRTVPPDTYQAKALIALFEKFSWNYAAILFADGDDYGRPLAVAFKDLAKTRGICIGFERVIPQNNRTGIDVIIKELKAMSELQIVLIFVPESRLGVILEAMVKFDVVNRTLIASDSWSLSAKSYGERYQQLLSGTIGLTHRHVPVKKFDDYFLSLTPRMNTWNKWFNKTWEHLFKCKLQTNKVNKNMSNVNKCDVEQQRLRKDQFSKYTYALAVINAVFSVAEGIRQFCQSLGTNKSWDDHSSYNLCLSSITPEKLTKRLFGMRFRGYDGSHIIFDKQGNVGGSYELINILPDLSHQTVGTWENSGQLHVNTSKIVWKSGKRPPQGVCAEDCRAGWSKELSMSSPQCCWKCRRCPEGTISNHSNAISCKRCGELFRTNYNKTECVAIPIEYFDWNNSFAVVLIIVALLAIVFLIFIAVLFFRFANTPAVKSANRELSFLLCLGLFATFLKPFAYAGMPTQTKCITSQLMFCVGAALALSAMLFKTFRIVLVFESKRRRWFLENKYEVALTIGFASLELMYCLIWLTINPPTVRVITITDQRRFMLCHFDSYWYLGTYVLLIALSLSCTALAYRGRKLPKNFNEAKYITSSMFTFIIIWAVFMGAQFAASTEYYSRINCFAVVMSSLMILVLLFGPKCFLLLFRPELNRTQEFQHEVTRYSFQASNMNIVCTSNNASSGTISMVSSQRVSALTEPSKFNLLTIPMDQFKRKRAHTFDTASIEHTARDVMFQSLSAIPSEAGQQQCWPRRQSDIVSNCPVPVLVSNPQKDFYKPDAKDRALTRQRLFDCMIEKKKLRKRTADCLEERCEYCHQLIVKPISLSVPNLPSASEFIGVSPVSNQLENKSVKKTQQKIVKDTSPFKQCLDMEIQGEEQKQDEDSTEQSPLLHSSSPDERRTKEVDENYLATDQFKSNDVRETAL